MKTFFKILFIYILAVVIDRIMLSYFPFQSLTPSFIFISAMAFAVIWPGSLAYVFSFLCGLTLDFTVNNFFGGYGLCLVLMTFAIFRLKERIDFNFVLAQIILIFTGWILIGLIYSILTFISAGIFTFGQVGSIMGTALGSCIVSPFVFYVLKKLFFKEHKYG